MWSMTAFPRAIRGPRGLTVDRTFPARGVSIMQRGGALTVAAVLVLTACGGSGAPDERKRQTAVAEVRATAETVAGRTEGLSEFTKENYEALVTEVKAQMEMRASLDPAEVAKRRYVVPFHAIKASDDDGRRAAEVTPADVAKWVDKANEVFAAAGVKFVFNPDPRGPDWTEIRDTALNNLESKLAHVRYAAQVSEGYPGKIVAIFRHGLGRTPVEDAYSSLYEKALVMPGFATSRWIVGKDSRGRWVEGQNLWMLAHELGHYMGLPHTFPNEVGTTTLATALMIMANGGDIDAMDGDQIPDTPPDAGFHYYIGRGWDPCKGPETYTVSETLRGRTFSWELAPDRHNVMSYFGCDPVHITPMQAQVVQHRLEQRGFQRVD